MTSENTQILGSQPTEFTSENTNTPKRPPGRQAVALTNRTHELAFTAYASSLAIAPIAAQTKRTYASKVRQYLAWLASADVDGDPLNESDARDWAARDYRTHLQTTLKRKPATINNAMAAIGDFYLRRGMEPPKAALIEIPKAAPRALGQRAQVRFLRAVENCPSPRDRLVALLPFYAGTRIAEIVSLDTDDLNISARKGNLRILGKGQTVREVPMHPHLRKAATEWLHERLGWPDPEDTAALLLNQKGTRLSARSAHEIITSIAATAGLEDDHITAHVLRHTFATTLIRGGTDIVIAAELLGHNRLETTRIYTRPTHADRSKAITLLTTDA